MIADMPSQSSRVDPERQQHIIDAALRVIASRGVAGTSHRVVAAEFYTLAARDLSFRDISDRWMSATQKVMGRFFDSETTVLLDAMIEGLTLHRALGGEPRNPQSIRDGIRRIIDHRR